MIRWLNKQQPVVLALLRITLGISMAYSGWSKVMPPNGMLHGHPLAAMDHFADYVATLGLPRFLGYVSAATEFVGGLWLIVGLFTRFAAFMICCNMLVALFTVNIRHGGYPGSEFVLLIIATCLLLVVAGAGALSVDHRLRIS